MNACDDFFNFVCGRYIKNTVIHDRYSDGVYQQSYEKEKQDLQLKKLLESTSSEISKSHRLSKDFFSTCLDQNQLEDLGSKPLLEVIEKLGGWSLHPETQQTNAPGWIALNDQLFRLGFTENYLIDVKLEADKRDVSRYIINITPLKASGHILDDFYGELKHGLESNRIKAYYHYMVSYAVLLGANEDQAKQEMMDILEFEMELCKVK